jgi:type I restriction enzyme S subunit
MKLFNSSVPAKDQVYIALRDYRHLVEARNHVEELWRYFEPYADPHFQNQIAVDFQARYWEMYLGCLALRARLPVMPNNGKGPDLRITLRSGRKLFIEAAAPGPGTGQNRVSEPTPIKVGDFNAIAEDIPVEQVLLRITSGVEEKFRAYNRYLRDQTLLPDAPYVVAVNPGGMTFARGENDPPLIIQALFALGSLMVSFDGDHPEFHDTCYSIRHQISKHSGASVRTNLFLDSAYRGLSAVIFSDAHPLSLPKPDGRELKLVHNPHAQNPIDRGLFKIGYEYPVEGTRIHSTNWNEYSSSY